MERVHVRGCVNVSLHNAFPPSFSPQMFLRCCTCCVHRRFGGLLLRITQGHGAPFPPSLPVRARAYRVAPSLKAARTGDPPPLPPPCCTRINHLCVAANSSDMSVVASYGFVVVAPMSCPTAQCGAKYAVDMLVTIRAIQNNEISHPGLAHADPNRTAVYGHSMGAMAAMRASATCNMQRATCTDAHF